MDRATDQQRAIAASFDRLEEAHPKESTAWLIMGVCDEWERTTGRSIDYADVTAAIRAVETERKTRYNQ